MRRAVMLGLSRTFLARYVAEAVHDVPLSGSTPWR